MFMDHPMHTLPRVLLVPVLLVAACAMASASETPQSLAEKLQQEFLAAPAVSLSFDLKNEEHLRILTDMRGGHIRMESPQLLIISDGNTIWNYDKSGDRVTIDNVTASSEFHDPASLFRFADNYTASLEHVSGNQYTLVLTPSSALQSLMHSAGRLQSLRLSVTVHGSRVQIASASATSFRGTTDVAHLKIQMLQTANASDFVFTPKASTKVIDLRE